MLHMVRQDVYKEHLGRQVPIQNQAISTSLKQRWNGDFWESIQIGKSMYQDKRRMFKSQYSTMMDLRYVMQILQSHLLIKMVLTQSSHQQMDQLILLKNVLLRSTQMSLTTRLAFHFLKRVNMN